MLFGNLVRVDESHQGFECLVGHDGRVDSDWICVVCKRGFEESSEVRDATEHESMTVNTCLILTVNELDIGKLRLWVCIAWHQLCKVDFLCI